MKEAQTLGILAMIAVGIILLCMWGGGASTEDAGELADRLADETTPAEPVQEPAGPTPQEQVDVMTERTEQEQIEEVAGPDLPDEQQYREMTDVAQTDDPSEIDMQSTETEGEESRRPRQARYHVVARGDNFSTLSEKYYGTSRYWKKLARVNEDVCANPRAMQIGMKLRIPYKDELENEGQATAQAPSNDTQLTARTEDTSSESDGRVYVVQKGDSLYKIAKQELGDGGKWKQILRKNRDVIKKDDTILPGMKLRL
jgi:nucleoid-associated protein YgaU